MVGSSQPKVLTEFYEKVFDKKPEMIDGDFAGWQVGSCFFGIGPHSEVSGKSKEPARIMVSLETKEVKEEFERIKALDSEVIKEPYEARHGFWIATLADPDGNYFQLMSPWEAPEKK